MRKKWKRIVKNIFLIIISIVSAVSYGLSAYKFSLGVNMSASTAISTDIALITIIITTIGLSISGYIFLNNYFGTLIQGNQSLTNIIQGLNKVYIYKVMGASLFSAAFIGCGFAVIVLLKDSANSLNEYAFVELKCIILQQIVYFGSFGTILYNFYFLCNIINPMLLIQKRAQKVVEEQIDYFKSQYKYISLGISDSRREWRIYKEIARNNIKSNESEYDCNSSMSKRLLDVIKYIQEMETIITKVIELNAIKGHNNSLKEALKFVFADTSVASLKYEKRIQTLCESFKELNFFEIKGFKQYESETSDMISEYVKYYENLVLLKNALLNIKMEADFLISEEVHIFVLMMLQATLERFSNFVKITKLNIGSGYFKRAIFNWSDLSLSNLTGGDFSEAQMKSSVFANCDLSNSKLDKANLCDSDFKNVNLGYASLIDANCTSIDLTNAKLTDVIFHERKNIYQNNNLKEEIKKIFNEESINWIKIKEYSEKVSNICVCGTKLNAATLDHVMIKSIDLSAIDLEGASFENSILTNSLWLCTTKATGLKMQNTNLRNSLAVQCDFSMSDFKLCNLGQGIFIDVIAHQSNFANMSGISMLIVGSAKKIHARKSGCQHFMYFWDKSLSDKDFKTTNIVENKYSNWAQINFHGINAVESKWYNTVLNESDFCNAILKNAIFENVAANWVNMEGCDLTYSKITYVSFRMAKLVSAIFTRSYLEQISFEDADLSKSNFIHASINNADFVQCNLSLVNLSHTIIQKSKFIKCELGEVYVHSTIFKGVIFDSASFRIFFEFYKQNGDITFDCCKILLEEGCSYKFLQKELENTETLVSKTSDDGTYLFVSERSIFDE